MRKIVVFLIALGVGAVAVSGQDDANADLKKKVQELEELLKRKAARGKAPQENFIIRRAYEVGDLSARIRHTRLEPSNLRPSKYAVPERELPEACSPFEVDMLIDVIRQIVEPDTWDTVEGAGIEVKNRVIFVTNIGRVHKGIARLLATLRAELRQVVVDVVAVPVTDATAAVLAERPRELTDEDVKALLQEEPLGAARVVCADSQMSVQRSGVKRVYLRDYDVNIAEKSSIGKPLQFEIFEGCSIEIRACLDFGAKGVVLACRLERTKLDEPMRTVETEHGKIDTPAMELTRVTADLWAPLGKTIVVGGCTAGARPCVFLLTPRLTK